MSGWLNRILTSVRKGSQNDRTLTQEQPPEAYKAALSLLGSERDAGRLDEDIALAAAQSLGRQYREKHPVNGDEAGAARDRQARQAELAAYRIREELLGDALPRLDAAMSDLYKRLADVREQHDIANRRNNDRPALDYSLPGGWERAVADSAARLRLVTSRVDRLAQAHAKAARGYETARASSPPSPRPAPSHRAQEQHTSNQGQNGGSQSHRETQTRRT